MNVLQGKHPRNDILYGLLDFLPHRQLVKDGEQQGEDAQNADDGDEYARGGELAEHAMKTYARDVEETQEYGHLPKKNRACEKQDKQTVNNAFRDNRTQGFGKRGVLILLQNAAPYNLADAWNDQTDGIGNENSIDADALLGMLVQRTQGLMPAQSSENLCQNARNE